MTEVSIFISYWTLPQSFQLTNCNSSFPGLPASVPPAPIPPQLGRGPPPTAHTYQVTALSNTVVAPTAHILTRKCLRITSKALQTWNPPCPPIQPLRTSWLIAMSEFPPDAFS